MKDRYVPSIDALRFQTEAKQVGLQGVMILTRDLTGEQADPKLAKLYGFSPETHQGAKYRLEKGSHTIIVELSTYDKTHVGHNKLVETRGKLMTLASAHTGHIKEKTDVSENIRYIPLGPDANGQMLVDFEHSTLDCHIEVVFRAPVQPQN